ncbi:RHS repeat-associated core domain-containing protein [Pseudomonas sp. PB120]|uniref:RHS repeat-associated core domain-containing protein n=1 Tax=Pseudomonas sp. PB120 TaxID=2494700 RepID=UPI0012FE50AE|nr:RHS repeat-associated core domain-containing protein [Pseudomonas sp. PB120]MVV47574.1 RHS repeat-associated core domain-containing protein [Pseudomonas sp. PB120]
MSSIPATAFCKYHYDPLDRLIGLKTPEQVQSQRFYCKNRLATETQGLLQCSIMQNGDQLLAQQKQQLGTAVETELLATDVQRSVLQSVGQRPEAPMGYSPYGHRPAESGLTSLLGFNGERRDAVTGHYLLGNGYRAFNPMLMRFNSPDSLSPFGKGGINTYVYCLGDPVNRLDKTGGFSSPWIKMATPAYIRMRYSRLEHTPWYEWNTRDIELTKHFGKVPFGELLLRRKTDTLRSIRFPRGLSSNVQLGKAIPKAGESLQAMAWNKFEVGSLADVDLNVNVHPDYSHLKVKSLAPIYKEGSMLVGDTIKHRNVMEDLRQSFAVASRNGSFRPRPSTVGVFSSSRIRNPEVFQSWAEQD